MKADKILCLGMDGMDPRFTQRMLNKGLMPNVQKLLNRGAANKDLIMLGGHPTITPPMWTTLACGCYATVHGITGYDRTGDDIDALAYNFDSHKCKAEQLWNVTAEAGLKTLVWHWPGSSWPPTSDSENLMVVDGSSPGAVGMAVNQVDNEFLVGANVAISEVTFAPKAAMDAQAPCIVEDAKLDGAYEGDRTTGDSAEAGTSDESRRMIIMTEGQKTTNFTEAALDVVKSPIKDASGWANAPENAKEFTVLLSKGLIRRPALILADENGKYTKVAIYKNKKAEEPIAILEVGKMVTGIVDEAVKANGDKYVAARNMRLLFLDENAEKLTIYVSAGMDTQNDMVWHPKRLFKEVMENVGPMAPTSMIGCQSKELITDCMLANWYASADWQSKAMLYVMDKENVDVVFSHYHGIDLQGHMFYKHMNPKDINRLPVKDYVKFAEDIYVQADYYIGQFVHLLDEGWTILVFSDHGLVSSKYLQPFLGDASGVNLRVMQELGFTEVKHDADGNELPEIDWTKTKACATGECHIRLSIKGRNKHLQPDGTYIDGIVDPADQYQVEEEIIDGLYNYRDPKTGKRIVSLALRNKDAILVGLSGPDSGDIIYFNEAGFNFDHGDCLSTTYGEEETSVSPIFLAAGKGIKQGVRTDRTIREVDFAPTVATLAGVRMPAQCEGAPVYQILED